LVERVGLRHVRGNRPRLIALIAGASRPVLVEDVGLVGLARHLGELRFRAFDGLVLLGEVGWRRVTLALHGPTLPTPGRGSDGKTALVTGASKGIGLAIADAYARAGANVMLSSRKADALEAAAAGISGDGELATFAANAGEPEQAAACVAATLERFGALDILVNNAAFQHNVESIEELSEEQWDRTFRINIYGYFHMAKAAVPRMQRGSAIINTGSITGLEGSKDLLDYSATKGAIHAFTKSLAQNLVERGIRVNCVAPGPVWTPLNVVAQEAEDVRKFGEDTPLGRPAQPEEIAPAYVFFASNADSSFITGEVLTLLGGETTAG
jgi:NAD(P)-dependent dehydrogenase (short-subunit alcohol dehydrogenase family)